MPEGRSARDRIRAFLEEHLGEVISTDEIARVAGIREYARRIRELRNDEGMQIISHRDRQDLKPGEYRLDTLERKPVVGTGISPNLRMQILERNGYTCQFCGAGCSTPDPFNPGRKLTLHVDHIVPRSQGGEDTEENLQVLCSACNHARSNIQAPSETALNLLARIRKAPRSVKREVYESLRREFRGAPRGQGQDGEH